MNSNSRELILAVVACLVCSTTSHVALTFPPARTYDLDFLDTSRTPGPCGMPKGKTSFFKIIFVIIGKWLASMIIYNKLIDIKVCVE